MKIREVTALEAAAPAFDQAAVLEAILELDEQYASGDIERAAYFIKKRALVRML